MARILSALFFSLWCSHSSSGECPDLSDRREAYFFDKDLAAVVLKTGGKVSYETIQQATRDLVGPAMAKKIWSSHANSLVLDSLLIIHSFDAAYMPGEEVLSYYESEVYHGFEVGKRYIVFLDRNTDPPFRAALQGKYTLTDCDKVSLELLDPRDRDEIMKMGKKQLVVYLLKKGVLGGDFDIPE